MMSLLVRINYAMPKGWTGPEMPHQTWEAFIEWCHPLNMVGGRGRGEGEGRERDSASLSYLGMNVLLMSPVDQTDVGTHVTASTLQLGQGSGKWRNHLGYPVSGNPHRSFSPMWHLQMDRWKHFLAFSFRRWLMCVLKPNDFQTAFHLWVLAKLAMA